MTENGTQQQFKRLEEKIVSVEKRLGDKIDDLRRVMEPQMREMHDHVIEAEQWKTRIQYIESTCAACPGDRKEQTREIDKRFNELDKRVTSNTRWIIGASGAITTLMFLLGLWVKWMSS